MDAQYCPACGAQRLPDLRPACDCALRARQADQASEAEVAPGTVVVDEAGPVFGQVAPPGQAEAARREADVELFDELEQTRAQAPPAQPLPPEVADAGAGDGLVHASGDAAGHVAGHVVGHDEDPYAPVRNRKRPAIVFGLAAAVVLTAGALGAAGGMFSSEPGADGVSVRAGGPSDAASPSAADSPDASASKSERASRSSTRPASPSESASARPSSSASPSSGVTRPSSSASASKSPSPSSSKPSSSPAETPGTLRRGDRGDEVVELQLRLQQLQLYVGAAHGNYNAEVEQAVARFQEARAIGEESGVYGPVTRRQVEAETSDPD
ncbi:peptidoglycan-binding domain-containing protein [Streptomyces sp. NBC_01304]|uniref:peptidoglycan-binding domain-containing protein n=1 Tax=Streptomyces sp. NBC_01304 TaxID=2903818 RepID=UPI002E111F08|nr:peptidoglycan-binding protein [Streptomyces sp. NBC_01304]